MVFFKYRRYILSLPQNKFMNFAGFRPNYAEQAAPEARKQPQLSKAQVRHQHILRAQPLRRRGLLRHPQLPGEEPRHVQRGPAAAHTRVQEQVPAEPVQRGPQHGLGDEEARPHPLLPVQEVPGVSDEDSESVQSVLHPMHQTK